MKRPTKELLHVTGGSDKSAIFEANWQIYCAEKKKGDGYVIFLVTLWYLPLGWMTWARDCIYA